MKVLSFNIDKDSIDSIVYKINTYFPFHKVELLTDNDTLSAVIYELPHHKPMPLTSTNPGEEMLVFIPLGYSVKHVSSVKINGSTADYFKVNGGLFVKAALSGILNVEIVSRDNTIFYPIKVSSIWNTDSSTNTWTNPTTATESIAYPFSAGPIKIEPKQNYKNLPENTEVLAIIKDRVIYRKLGLVEKPVIVSGSYSNPTTHSIELEFDIIGTVYIDGKEVPDTYISGNTIDLSSWASAENIRGIEGGIHQVVSVGSYTTYGTYTLNYIPVDNNDNDKVKVSSNDTTEGYLIDKITAGAGIQLAELNDGGDEDLEISTEIEVDRSTISSIWNGAGAISIPLSAKGKILAIYTSTNSSSDYLELPDLSTVPDGWYCWIVRRPDSPGYGYLTLKPKSGNTINSYGSGPLQIAPECVAGFERPNGAEGWFVAKHTSTDWLVQQVGMFYHAESGVFNIQALGDTGIYMRSRTNQNTYFQVQGAGIRGQLRWTSGYNTYIEPNPQFWDCGVKIERMAATGGTYGMHLAVGDVAPGGSGGYRVFVIGNGTAPSAAPSSGAQMWAESGVLKVQPQDGNTLSVGGGSLVYPADAEFDGYVGVGRAPNHGGWRLTAQGKWVMQLSDSSGTPVLEAHGDGRVVNLMNNTLLQGYHQDLELRVNDGSSRQGLIIDQSTGDVSIPHNLTVSGTLTNTEVQDNTTHRTTTGNPHDTTLDDLTDVNAPSPSDGEVLTWDAATGKWVSASGGGGVTDHGALTGLGDDDHTQYSLVSGARAFTGPVGGVDPTDATHLTTKNYVDNGLAGKADTIHGHTVVDIGDFDAGVSNNTDVTANTSHRTTIGNPHSSALNDLTDVSASSPSDGDTLTWDAGSGKWVNTSGGSGGVTDHGMLTGLEDDDHPHYFLADGARTLEGPLTQQTTGSGTLMDGHNRYYYDTGTGAVVSGIQEKVFINRTGTTTFDPIYESRYQFYRYAANRPNAYNSYKYQYIYAYGSPVAIYNHSLSTFTINPSYGYIYFRVYSNSNVSMEINPYTTVVGIKKSGATYTLDVGGDINTSTLYRINGTEGFTGTVDVLDPDGSTVHTFDIQGGIIVNVT